MTVSDSPPVVERLRATGLRVTRPRRLVLEVLDLAARTNAHLTVAEIAERVRGAGAGMSTQGAYDALDAMRAAGLVRRIEPAGSPALFESRVDDDHHHLVCRNCGLVKDVETDVRRPGSAHCLEPVADHGFVVEQAEVIFWGRCPSCAARQAQSENEERKPQ